MEAAHQPTADPLGAYVEALIACTGTLMHIVDHMLAFDAARPPGAEQPEASIPETLRRILGDVLAPETDRRPEADFALAAELVERTTEVIGREIYLVAPEPPPEDCAGARRRRRRRR